MNKSKLNWILAAISCFSIVLCGVALELDLRAVALAFGIIGVLATSVCLTSLLETNG